MKVDYMLSVQEVTSSDEDVSELRERMAALSERIVALAEAANIIAEAAAPFRNFNTATANDTSIPSRAAPEPESFKALDRAAARLEAARLAAVDEFTTVQMQLGDDTVHH